jgi:hypothetical protein
VSGYVLRWVGGETGDALVWFVKIEHTVDGRGRRMMQATWSAHLSEAKVFPTRKEAEVANVWNPGRVAVFSLAEVS